MYRRKTVKERSSEKSRGDIVQNILTPYFPCLSDTTSLGSALPSCSQATEHLSVAMPVFQKTVKTAIRTFGYQVREGTSRLRRNGAHNLRPSSYPFGGGRSEARWSHADKGKAAGLPSTLFRTMSVSLGRGVCQVLFLLP
jgi:hypothetical protein